jgi:hypothetical protein
MKIEVTDHGSVWQFRPLDKEASDFLRNVGAEGWQFMGETLCIDHRPARAFIEQASADGVEFV